jgi:FkbM family methyltransferase
MKETAKLILQKLLGLKTYLFVFSVFVIIKLRWDKKEKDFMHFLEIIPPGGLILDIGANIGVTSYYLSKRFPESLIFSFEPLKININTLKSILKTFNLKNVRPFEVALGTSNGNAEMVMPVIGKVKFHGLAHVVHNELKENNSGIKYQVAISKLDDIAEINASGLDVKGIKMDVENFEYYVLQGGEKLITRYKPVIYCELWNNENRIRCIDFLNSIGYRTFVLQGKKLVQCNDFKVEKNNFFFLPAISPN